LAEKENELLRTANAWPTKESVKEVKAASKELLKHGNKEPKIHKDAIQDMEKIIKRKKVKK
jgi:hypothetical protein